MQTTLWDWAERQGLTVPELAKMIGYDWAHVYRLRRGDWPITRAFAGRVVLALGDWARELFTEEVVREQS